MRKFIILIIAVFCSINVFASEYDDLLFAAGLYGDGNLELAQVELEKYLTNNPESKYAGEAKYLLASILLEKKNYKEASQLFESLISMPPNNLQYNELVINLAAAYSGNNEHQKVIMLLSRSQIDNPPERKAMSLYLLGSSYFAIGENLKSAASLNESLEILKSKDTFKRLAEVYIKTNKISKAKKLIEEMIELYPLEDATAYTLLEYYKVNLENGNYDAIFNTGYDLIKSNSPYFDQYSLVAAIASFETQQYEESLKKLERLDSFEASYYKALNYIKLDEAPQAKPLLDVIYNETSGKLKANSLFYLGMIESEQLKKLQLFRDFIQANPDNQFIAEANYQAGLAAFKLDDYKKSEMFFKEALEAGLSESLKQEAEFLVIESNYLSNNYQKVIETATKFSFEYPQSDYLAEVHFKIALAYYNLKEYSKAEETFKLLIYNFSQSERIGLSNFYLAEINLLQGKTETARNYYSAALEGNSDKELSWLRIAQSWFKDDEMTKAGAALKNISDNSAYRKNKILLGGDIDFQSGNYTKAIKKFDEAIALESDPEKKEAIIARKAWTYYQMGDYSQASSIYKQLSIKTDKPASYTFQSATALFSAQNYELALEQYLTFVENFPDNKNYPAAMVGIADCYYNLQNYEEARKQYRSLLTKINQEELYESILDGWKWATEQSGKNFQTELNDFLSGDVPYNFYFLVSAYRANYLFSIEEYEESVSVINDLLHRYNYPMKELEFIKAKAFKKLGKWDEAEDYYAHLFMDYHDPNLQYEWSEVSIHFGKPETAIKKLQYASDKTKKSEYIIKLLEYELQYKHKDFDKDYNKFITSLKDIYLENAEILRAKWLIDNNRETEAENLIEILGESSYKESQAQAQYLRGLSLYSQTKYNEAIPELLRVRHLFPFLIEVRQQAEELAFMAYLKVDKIDEAKHLLDNIKSELSTQKVNELQNLLEDK